MYYMILAARTIVLLILLCTTSCQSIKIEGESLLEVAVVRFLFAIELPNSISFSYPNTEVEFVQGESSSTTPESRNVTSFNVAPDLPDGLTIDSETGAISGTPTVSQSRSEYTISARNSSAGVNETIYIAISGSNSSEPSLNFASSYSYTVGDSVSITPTTSGTITSCSTSPSLPSGLSINDSSCVISGTANSSQSATTYTVSASDGSSTATTSFTLAIYTTISISYSGSYIYTIGDAVSITPTTSGDITACSISPSLPTGLSIDSSCAISGTATTSHSSSHTVTASNGGGSNTSSISLTITGTDWQQQAYIKAPNNDASDRFGWSVALYNDTLAVGSVLEASNQTTITNGNTASSDNSVSEAGAVYVFVRSGTTWSQQAYIKAANAGTASDKFGETIALDTDTLAVGAYQEDSNQTTITNGTGASTDDSASDAGAVYVYTRSGTTWSQQAYIKAANAESSDNFGWRVALTGDTLAVSAFKEASNQTTITNGTGASTDNSASDSGAVYIYTRSGTTWTQEAYIKASNAEASDFFGYNIALSGDTLAVGSIQEDSNQTTITNGTSSSSDNTTVDCGAVFVYTRSGTTWSQQAYLKAPNAGSGDNLGIGMAIDGDTIVAGAYQEDSSQTTITNGTSAGADDSTSNAGAAYVFKRSGTTWAQEAYLKAPNPSNNDYFGLHTSISGDIAIVGANQEDSNQIGITNGTTASADNSASNAGAAYVFKRSGSTWAQESYIKTVNMEANDRLGYGVAVYGTTIAVGAFKESSNQTTITNGNTASTDNSNSEAGAVYVFTRT
ncbi:MAG: putative Ig domain-containing protein [Spirochaetota bacterium]